MTLSEVAQKLVAQGVSPSEVGQKLSNTDPNQRAYIIAKMLVLGKDNIAETLEDLYQHNFGPIGEVLRFIPGNVPVIKAICGGNAEWIAILFKWAYDPECLPTVIGKICGTVSATTPGYSSMDEELLAGILNKLYRRNLATRRDLLREIWPSASPGTWQLIGCFVPKLEEVSPEVLERLGL